jgi:septal ring factor EnvC (AmiA/AmiB activator)
MDLITASLLAVAFIAALFCITFLLFTRHRANRHVTKVAQAGHDIRADLERLSNETNSKIVKLENEINMLKIEFASVSIQLVSVKASKAAATPKISASTQKDTWTRSENLVDVSIVPTITEFRGNDTWVRNEIGSDAIESGE